MRYCAPIYKTTPATDTTFAIPRSGSQPEVIVARYGRLPRQEYLRDPARGDQSVG